VTSPCRLSFSTGKPTEKLWQGGVAVVTRSLREQAELAIASVVEAHCPLCRVELRVHDGRGCCPCCGDSYHATTDRLDMRPCPVHDRHCGPWQAVWASRGEV
jgi:hypothetical protein